MSKKVYVKPSIDMIALRLEERLAVCDSWYLSKWHVAGCNSNQYQVTSPGTCYYIDEYSGS